MQVQITPTIDELVAESLRLIKALNYQAAYETGQRILVQDAQHETGLHIVGLTLLRLGKAEEAVPYLERTVRNKFHDGHSHWQFAQALEQTKQYERAITHFDRAMELGITDPQLTDHLYNTAGHVFSRHCHWADYDRIQRLVRQSIMSTHRWIIGESTLASPYFSNALLRMATEKHAGQVLSGVGQVRTYRHQPPKGKIRLGFVGCDFFEQATAYLMVGFIEALDRNVFEIYAYEHGEDRPHTTFRTRVMQAYDHFVRIDDLSDMDAADRIHQDQIDVLLSIKNPASARLGIFAHRPAAIQIHYLYYPGTSGMPFFDYFIGDDVVTPHGCESGYTEKILRLKGCYQPNDDRRVKAQDTTRKDWGLPDDAVVLANFNQSYKYTPQMFDLWCQLVRMDSRRVLWLLAENDDIRKRLTREAEMRGIAANRVFFGGKIPSPPYLNRLRQADLIIDTYPYGGHTLGSDALWSGTPILTLCGETYASRVAASLLHAVGMEELIAYSEQEFLDIGNRLLNDPAERQRMRAHLDGGREQFDVFDSKNYAWRFGMLMQDVVQRHWN